jgi:hypothetical protein
VISDLIGCGCDDLTAVRAVEQAQVKMVAQRWREGSEDS